MSIYREILEAHFDVKLIPDLKRDLSESIVWCFMGLHRTRPKCRYLIHDYRSLSTGLSCALKDKLKRNLNAKPDLRVFLNEKVREIMNFKDDVPSVLLDMGVPESILEYRETEGTPKYRFCYIGEISNERKSDKMLNAFLNSPYKNEPFLIIGRYDDKILKRFRSAKSLHFAGRFPQGKVFEMLQDCEYAICHFPNHRPHRFQTPTKLLEYACLGKAIIANRSASNLRVAKEFDLSILWGGNNIFDALELPQFSVKNSEFDAKPLFWEKRFEDSGIWKYLK